MAMNAATEERMLAKSYTDEVEVRRLSTGAYATRSARTADGLYYITTQDTCTCPSTHGYCKHMARVRALETTTEPEPTAPATVYNWRAIVGAPTAAEWRSSFAEYAEGDLRELIGHAERQLAVAPTSHRGNIILAWSLAQEALTNLAFAEQAG